MAGPNGQFSRRHKDNTALTEARARRETRIREWENRMDALEVARLNRTPKDQIKRLDKQLGVNKGAQRERNRLNRLVSEGLGDVTFRDIATKKAKALKAEAQRQARERKSQEVLV